MMLNGLITVPSEVAEFCEKATFVRSSQGRELWTHDNKSYVLVTSSSGDKTVFECPAFVVDVYVPNEIPKEKKCKSRKK